MPVVSRGPATGGAVIEGNVGGGTGMICHQLKRMSRRVPMGIARVGGYGANSSGDIFLAFSTANSGAAARKGIVTTEMLPNDAMSPLFLATAEATEEAIVNALVAAKTMVGISGNTVHALPHDRLIDLLKEQGRYSSPGI